jgi:hypothetical protein
MSRRCAGPYPINQFVAFDELNCCAPCARQFLRALSNKCHYIYEIVPSRSYVMLRRNDRREPPGVLPQRFVRSSKFGGAFSHPGFEFLSRFTERHPPARERSVRTGAAALLVFGFWMMLSRRY